MRTTLTLDDDVAAALAHRRDQRGTGLRHEVNALLRAGLAAASAPAPGSGESYELPTFDSGRSFIDDRRAMKDGDNPASGNGHFRSTALFP